MTDESREKRRKRMKVWRDENKEAIKEYQKKWRQENSDEISAYQKEYQAEYRSRDDKQQWFWEKNLLANYGITPDDFNQMWDDQDGKCAVCFTKLTPRGRNGNSAAVDHNHETGEVRALLCRSCNHAIGQLKDSPAVLESAIRYLRVFGYYGPDEIEGDHHGQ